MYLNNKNKSVYKFKYCFKYSLILLKMNMIKIR